MEQARLMVASQRGYLPIDQIGHLDKPMSGIERIELSYKGKPIQRNYFVISNLNNERLVRQSGSFLICGKYNVQLKEKLGQRLRLRRQPFLSRLP